MVIQWASLLVVTALLSTVVALCLADTRRRRPPPGPFSVSFLIPCYNDGATIERTIRAVFALSTPGPFEVLVVDDGSTDDSWDHLQRLARRYPLSVRRQLPNRGKADTLNRLAADARHEVLLFLDADTAVSQAALDDMLSRLTADPRLAGVSCPYQPANRGFLPRMQSVEYSMIALVQGAYNCTSALGMWGGCIAVRRPDFLGVGGFTLSAITEDVDLAHKLNRAGRRVEQSFVPVRSEAPDTLRAWLRQKVRWTSGGFQCLLRHPSVWLRNPLHVALVCTYGYLSVASAYGLAVQLADAAHLWEGLKTLTATLPWTDALRTTARLHENGILNGLKLAGTFTLFSVVYIIPLITRGQDILKLLLVIPFSLGYFPLYALVSVFSMAYFLFALRPRLRGRERAW